jgi:hexosaminidase
MLRLLIFAIILLTPVFAIWPRPQNMTSGTTPLRLSPRFSIKFSHRVPKDLSDAAQRTTQFLRTDRLQALVPDRGASSSSIIHSANALRTLTVHLAPSNGEIASLTEEVMKGVGEQDETYCLEVPTDGSTAILSVNTALGVFRGLTTFEQLWYDLDGLTYTLHAPVLINDAPAYVSPLQGWFHCGLLMRSRQPYRGLMLDTSRNL